MDRRQQIIEAARARFRHYGIQKTTMQEIAQDAGVAVGTLYRYFADKDDLVVACADDFVARHRRAVEEALASGLPPDERLRRYILGRYHHCREVGTASRHVAELARAVLRLKPDRLLEEAAMMEQAIGGILHDGILAGLFQIPDPERDTRVFLLSIAYFFPTATQGLSEWPREDWLMMVMDWFIEVWRRAAGQSDSGDRKRSR